MIRKAERRLQTDAAWAGAERRGAKSLPRMVPEEIAHRKLVRRSHFLTIIAAWLITVPASALLSAGIFLIVQSVMNVGS